MNWDKNEKVLVWFKKKSENVRVFRVFDFALYLKSKTRKSPIVFFYFKLKIRKRQKFNWDKNVEVEIWFRKKRENFRGFQVFDFGIYPKPKTRKFQKVLFYFLTLVVTRYSKSTKMNWEKHFQGYKMVLEEKRENFRGFRIFLFILYPKLKTRKSRKVFFYVIT